VHVNVDLLEKGDMEMFKDLLNALTGHYVCYLDSLLLGQIQEYLNAFRVEN